MNYTYESEKLKTILEMLEDDDTVTMNANDFREMIAAAERRKGTGRKPIALDETKFDEVVSRWMSGEITARVAMNEVGLKPNTFYRRVKERYDNVDELKKKLKKAAKAEKEDMKELRKQVKKEAKEIKKAAEIKEDVDEKAEDAIETVSAHKMERKIRKEKIAAKIDRRKEMRDLKKEVEAEVKTIKNTDAE